MLDIEMDDVRRGIEVDAVVRVGVWDVTRLPEGDARVGGSGILEMGGGCEGRRCSFSAIDLLDFGTG
jgi:hypothetical protein